MPELIYEKRGNYAIFTMNRPERMNANNNAMTDQLWDAVEDFNHDFDMRVAILTGAGRAFSTGHDMKEMNEKISALGLDTMSQTERIAMGQEGAAARIGKPNMPFPSSPKPWIAAINGPAAGSGFGRALNCDIRIASSEAWCAFFEVTRGRVSIGTIDLPRMSIPSSHAAYALFTAERLTPEKLLQFSIVSEVVPPDRLLPRAIEIAEKIAENAPLALKASKEMLWDWRQTKLREAERLYEALSLSFRYSDDAMEGPRAFAERRKPQWKGR